MLVRHYSTSVSDRSFPNKDLAFSPHSGSNKVVDQDDDSWHGYQSLEDTFSDKGESLYLNFTETDDALVIEAELSVFAPDEVDISFQHKSLIIAVCSSEEPNKSYYLGDYSRPDCRWTIPVGIELEDDSVRTLFRNGTVIISVMKSVGVVRLAADETAAETDRRRAV